jgi:Probable zinc-ribbon domain
VSSNKQRESEIKAKRAALKKAVEKTRKPKLKSGERMVPVNETLLAPYNSYGMPDYVTRGYYLDIPFRCAGCGKNEVWSGTQQKWWYEIAKGYAYSGAKFCRSCRRKERERKAGARRIHLDGIKKKPAKKRAP